MNNLNIKMSDCVKLGIGIHLGWMLTDWAYSKLCNKINKKEEE